MRVKSLVAHGSKIVTVVSLRLRRLSTLLVGGPFGPDLRMHSYRLDLRKMFMATVILDRPRRPGGEPRRRAPPLHWPRLAR